MQFQNPEVLLLRRCHVVPGDCSAYKERHRGSHFANHVHFPASRKMFGSLHFLKNAQFNIKISFALYKYMIYCDLKVWFVLILFCPINFYLTSVI